MEKFRAWVLSTFSFGSLMKAIDSPAMPGTMGELAGCSTGMGAAEPSIPIRNALLSLLDPAQEPSVRGPLQVVVCEKPVGAN